MATEPNPDDFVLIDAKEALALVTRKTRELQDRVAALEAAKLLQQSLIDSLHSRLSAVEALFGKGQA